MCCLGDTTQDFMWQENNVLVGNFMLQCLDCMIISLGRVFHLHRIRLT